MESRACPLGIPPLPVLYNCLSFSVNILNVPRQGSEVRFGRNGVNVEQRLVSGVVGGLIYRLNNYFQQVPESLLVHFPLLVVFCKLKIDLGEVHSHRAWDELLHECLGEVKAESFELSSAS